MAALLSISAGWLWFLLLVAIATATATANSKATAIPALETGSSLSIKLEASAVESKPTNESELVGSFAKSKDETNDAASFPGIYTAKYTYAYQSSESVSDTTNANNNNRSWLQESDVIRFECNGDGDNTISDAFLNTHDNDEKKNNNANNVRDERNSLSCKGHLLIRSEDEYRNIASAIRSEPSSVVPEQEKSSSSFSNYPPSLRSLEYDSILTERWVHPRMKVVAESASLAGRRLENENSAKPSLRRAGGEARHISELKDRSDNDLWNNDNYDYSTIPKYDCYYDYQGTMDWIRDFVAKHTDSSLLEVTWNVIGDSWKKKKSEGLYEGDSPPEGYDINALTITRKPKNAMVAEASASATFHRTGGEGEGDSDSENGDNNKAPFLIVSSTHAREYTPPVLVRLWLEHLVEKVLVEGDPAYWSMLEHTKIHWIPYLNPDGRVIAETTEPLRRKNMNNEWTGNTFDSAICTEDGFGVDLNRNFPFEWGKDDGSSTKACSSFSRGSGPGSEPETQALVSYGSAIFPNEQINSNALNDGKNDYWVTHHSSFSVTESSKKWRGYDPQTTKGVFIDVHSYGEVYIYPWGNINSISPNDVSFRSAMGHIESMTGLRSKGPGFYHYGVASGATDDWAYGVLGAFSMTWELGSDFHEPCQDFEDNYQKHFGAFEYLANIAPFPFALGKGPIVQEIKPPEGTIALYYSEQQQVRDAYSNVTILGEWEAEEIVLLEKKKIALLDNGETIEISVVIKLPDVIPSTLDPIDFDDGEKGGEEEPPSSIAKIRIFYGASNPLVGAKSANSTFADQSGGYWEINLSGEDSSLGTNNEDGSFSYELSLTKNQLFEAFGDNENNNDDEAEAEASTDQLLYFQAMDNEGNLGPIAATRLIVVVLKEIARGGDDDFDDDLETKSTQTFLVPQPSPDDQFPPTAAPQSQPPFTSPPRPTFSWRVSEPTPPEEQNAEPSVGNASKSKRATPPISDEIEYDFGTDDGFLKDKEDHLPSSSPQATASASANLGGGSSWVSHSLLVIVFLVSVIV